MFSGPHTCTCKVYKNSSRVCHIFIHSTLTDDFSQDSAVSSSHSTNTNLQGEDSFFSAFLNNPTPSKPSTSRNKTVRSPGRLKTPVENTTKKTNRQISQDGAQDQVETRVNKTLGGESRSSNREKSISEQISVDLVACETEAAVQKDEGQEKGTTEHCVEKQISTANESDSLSNQSLNTLEISIDESGSMIGSSSSFVPISKEDVEECQYSPSSQQSNDELMSISQTQLKQESLLTDTSRVKIDEAGTVSEKDLKNREGSPSSAKSEHSEETNNTSSSSDFVVINEFTASEQSSLSNYDTRESPESQSPKHFSSSSNGKRSPDSDFSIISEGRFHDMTDIQPVPSLLEPIDVDFNPRDSTTCSADVDSEDQDEKEVSCVNTSFKSLGSSSEFREEGNRTPTPTQEEHHPFMNQAKEDVNMEGKTLRSVEKCTEEGESLSFLGVQVTVQTIL